MRHGFYGTLPPAAGGASPPGPPDRQGAGAGYGFEFLLRKNYKTGGINNGFNKSIGDTSHRHVAGRGRTSASVTGRSALPTGGNLCATAPAFKMAGFPPLDTPLFVSTPLINLT